MEITRAHLIVRSCNRDGPSLAAHFLGLHALFVAACFQIVASGSTVYKIPWPPAFQSFISSLRLFLADVISISKANCTQPTDYYAGMVVVFVGLKVLLALLLVGPWVLRGLLHLSAIVGNTRKGGGATSPPRTADSGESRSGMPARGSSLESAPASFAGAKRAETRSGSKKVGAVDWLVIFKASFMLLFVAYPGTIQSRCSPETMSTF